MLCSISYHNSINHFLSSKTNKLQRQLSWREAIWAMDLSKAMKSLKGSILTNVSLELLVGSLQEASQLLLYLLAFWIIWVLLNVAYREGGCLMPGPAPFGIGRSLSIWFSPSRRSIIELVQKAHLILVLAGAEGLHFVSPHRALPSCLCTSFLCKQSCCCQVHSAVSQASICDLAVPRPPLEQGWLKERLCSLTAVPVTHRNRKIYEWTTNAFEYNEVIVPAHPAVATT